MSANIHRQQPLPGQESVWDYPRPPRVEPTAKHIRIVFNGETIAETDHAIRILETSHPPVYYIPPSDIRMEYFSSTSRSTFCEFKGAASYWTIRLNGRAAENVAWSYRQPATGFEAIKNYLAIEKIRFEDKLEVTYDFEPAAEKCQLPGFLIHPLVENAVKHGMTNNSGPLKICITARMRDGRLVVEIANTGRLNARTPAANGSGTQIGLRNVRERLAKLYPDKSSFSLRQDGAWIRATIELVE